MRMRAAGIEPKKPIASAPAKAPAIVRRLIVARIERLQERQRKIVEELLPACVANSIDSEVPARHGGELLGLRQGIAAFEELLQIPELADGGES